MKGYLGTAVGLLTRRGVCLPDLRRPRHGTDDLLQVAHAEELDQLLAMAAQRYLRHERAVRHTDDASAIVEAVRRPASTRSPASSTSASTPTRSSTSLDLLLEAKSGRRSTGRRARPHRTHRGGWARQTVADDTVASLVARHGVTHLQCTPSLAAMLVADPTDRAALRSDRPPDGRRRGLPTALATELRELAPRPLHQHVRADRDDDLVAHPRTGRGSLRPGPHRYARSPTRPSSWSTRRWRVPLGRYGELHIGGEGVPEATRRPELTAERFVDRPGHGSRLRHGRRRPRPSQRVRRVRRAGRQPSQAARAPHRARRDRDGARPHIPTSCSRWSSPTRTWGYTPRRVRRAPRRHRSDVGRPPRVRRPTRCRTPWSRPRASARRLPAHTERQDRSSRR